MRRVMTLISASLIVLLAAAPMAAASERQHYGFQGKGVEVYWVSDPDVPLPPGSTVTEAYLQASQGAIDDNGTTFTDGYVYMDVWVYRVDRQGDWEVQSATIYEAYGDDVDLVVDRKLTKATLTATLTVYPCQEDRHGFSCEPSGETAELTVSLTGTGALFRSSGHSTTTGGGTTYVSNNKGTSRVATATASIDGSSLGSSSFAYIYDSSWRDLYIER